MDERELAIETVVSQPYGENSYVVWLRGSREAVVVDPGFEPQSILDLLRRESLSVAAILNTHGHVDHIAGNRAIKGAFPDAPLIIGRNEARLLSDPDANLSAPFGLPITSPPADRLVDDDERFEVAGLPFEVREIPGHSPGSVVFVCDLNHPPFVLGGDVLFAGSVGRTDFKGGDQPRLFAGIKDKLFNLPDDAVILPGHGPTTTVGAERRTNPFVGANAGLYRLH